MLRGMKIALTPQPPLPERIGGAKSRKLLSPSPKGRGARGEGLRNFHVTSVIKRICADLKAIYTAATESESEAEFNLELLAEKWDKQYPSISKSWRSHWANIIPFFAFPSEIRRAIYTTKALESMNSSLRKVIKSKQICPVKLSTICLF